MSGATVTLEKLMTDAAGVLRMARDDGPVSVVGEDGRVGIVIDVPRDFHPEPEELARKRIVAIGRAYLRRNEHHHLSTTHLAHFLDMLEQE